MDATPVKRAKLNPIEPPSLPPRPSITKKRIRFRIKPRALFQEADENLPFYFNFNDIQDIIESHKEPPPQVTFNDLYEDLDLPLEDIFPLICEISEN